jgi:hypothetical protein
MTQTQKAKQQSGVEPPHSMDADMAQAFAFLEFGFVSSFGIRICFAGLEDSASDFLS